MRHVFRRQLGTAAILAILAVTILAGGASAAFTTGSSGAATCTPQNDPTGGCNFTGNGTATFRGEFVQPVPVVDPSLCPPQAGDPQDLICGHYFIQSTVSGTATVTINFDAINDLDLCIFDAADQVVACSTGSGASETVIFTVQANTRYEARILPISFGFGQGTPFTPATYTGSVQFFAGGAGGGNVTPKPPPASGDKVTGGGQTATVNVADANFSVNAFQSPQGLQGKLRIAMKGCDFRSTEYTAFVPNRADTSAVIRGRGTLTQNGTTSSVTFEARADDNGEGTGADTFTIDQCNGGGRVVAGNVQYHPS